MLVIRLSRAGSKKKPHYHISVADQREARDGRFVEQLGFFNPVARGASEGLRFDVERYDYWVRRGAQPSERIKKLARIARRQDTGTPTAASPEPEGASDSDSGEAAA
ncbi:MAG: 30S ribosomal protein S16 [Gammaproteobacteria bacterium]|nr:30S ribosomal protein S16 [Gammaproteobacteria bacterium]